MNAPSPWRAQTPADPDEARAARLLSRVETPTVPKAAKARVWHKLHAPSPERPTVFVGVVLAGVTLAGLFLLTMPRAAEAPSAPAVAEALAPKRPQGWTTGVDQTERVRLDALAELELGPSTRLIRQGPEASTLTLVRGQLQVQALQSGLRIVAGRYAFEPAQGSLLRVQTDPLSYEVLRGSVDQHGPEGPRRLHPPSHKPTAEVTQPPRVAAKQSPKQTPVARPRPAPVELSPGPGGPRTEANEPDMGAWYRQARAEADPALAIALYDRVLSHGGPWAEMAGHQAVRLCRQAGRQDEALARLERLQARFPSGAHLVEVWLARIEILVELDRLPEAMPDLNRYLQSQGDSLRAPDLYFLRGELHRRAGRSEAAQADYHRVVRGPYAAAAQATLERMKKE